MDSQAILEKIRELLTELFDDSNLNVTLETSAPDVEGWDSIAHINLVMQVEREFGIKFALGEMQDLRNVGDMVKLVESKRG